MNNKPILKSYIKPVLIIIIFALMVMNPEQMLAAAKYAINTWWNSVLPSLLPFFILAELFNNLGINNCLSIWLEPLMRPVFRLPGSAALSMVVGFVAGSPTGAMVTADLRRRGLCSREEGERLLAFTNNAGPFFILSAVSAGILQAPEIGILLMLSHYPVNLLFGFCLRFFAGPEAKIKNRSQKKRFVNGILALREQAPRSFLTILTASIKKSMLTIGIIACYMIVFSLLSALIAETGLSDIIIAGLGPVCALIGIDPAAAKALEAGLLEMTIGIAALPNTGVDLLDMTISAAFILAFNGISIQAQVAAMVSGTDLKLTKYLICRLIHAFIAPFIIYAFWQKITPALAGSQTTGVDAYANFSPILPIIISLIALALMVVISLTINRLTNR